MNTASRAAQGAYPTTMPMFDEHLDKIESKAVTTCMACFRSHVKCERSIPCRRCIRLGLECVPNPRPRGRPKKALPPPLGTEPTGFNAAGIKSLSVMSPLSGPPPPVPATCVPMGSATRQPPSLTANPYAPADRYLGTDSQGGLLSAVPSPMQMSARRSSGLGGDDMSPSMAPSPAHGSVGHMSASPLASNGESPARATGEGRMPVLAGDGGSGMMSIGLGGPSGPLPPVGGMHLSVSDVFEGGAPFEPLPRFIKLMSNNELAVDRARTLLSVWNRWHVRSNIGGPRLLADLEKMASMIDLDLSQPVSPPRSPTTTDHEDLQRFLELCVDEDGSATCTMIYHDGGVSITCNPRFTAMYMSDTEADLGSKEERVRPEVYLRKLVSPESVRTYDGILCQACFRGQDQGGEACEVFKCVDRYQLELSCFVRLRVFASTKRPIAAVVVSLLPLVIRHVDD